jgi:hypothetical protein
MTVDLMPYAYAPFKSDAQSLQHLAFLPLPLFLVSQCSLDASLS